MIPIDEETEYIPLLSQEEEEDLKKVNIPDVLPILPLRNTVLFPGVVIPITMGRDKSLKLVQEVYKKNKILGAIEQQKQSDQWKDEKFIPHPSKWLNQGRWDDEVSTGTEKGDSW